jgi:iron-sulfur cluster protein
MLDSKNQVRPREIANKQSKSSLKKAIQMSLAIQSDAVRHNTQSFNSGRYRATAKIFDYEALKDQARSIKENAIEDLPDLLETLQRSVKARGGHVLLARTAREASEYITRVCLRVNAKLVVKAKSITSEEIRLNHYLEKAGIEVAETDLAEFIIQIADEQPSHFVAPAIHWSRERISQLFKSNFETDEPLDSGEDLTKFARDILRKKFLTADVGITGANLIAADSGTLMLVESEGNIRMVTHTPSVHIALAGIEKIVPSRDDFAPFLELLAPSATGQPLTSYTQIISPPLDLPPFSFDQRLKSPREFHLVLLDNGRMKMRDDKFLREALYCIRCGACLNSCANFQSVGGHAFGGETYSGGIGGSWEAGVGQLENARFSELCTGCSRCRPQCPVRIDIPWLNEVLRSRLNEKNEPGMLDSVFKGLMPVPQDETNTPLTKKLFSGFYSLAVAGSKFAPFSNWILNSAPVKFLLEKMFGVDRRRRFPEFHRNTLTRQFGEIRPEPGQSDDNAKVLLFADVYTNYTRPQAGLAAVKLLRALGLDVELSQLLNEGRAALSQGMLKSVQRQALEVAGHVGPYVQAGYRIVVVEPSVLALFRHDYSHFLDREQFVRFRDCSFEPFELIQAVVREKAIKLEPLFDLERARQRVFYHSHCQQRTCGAADATVDFLNLLGVEVITSQVECCGMAGSFGYKKDFYDVSMRVGEDLLSQINKADPNGSLTLLASGVSCYEQIQALTGRRVQHPLEFVVNLMK